MKSDFSLVAMVDIGATTVKEVILRAKEVFYFSIIPTGHSAVEADTSILQKALEQVPVYFDDPDSGLMSFPILLKGHEDNNL